MTNLSPVKSSLLNIVGIGLGYVHLAPPETNLSLASTSNSLYGGLSTRKKLGNDRVPSGRPMAPQKRLRERNLWNR
jgi:hypothetical protein